MEYNKGNIGNKIKIIFIDLDGTLLNINGEITSYTKEILGKVRAKGINVILCSGRANNDTIKNSKKINATPIVISNNGSMIFNYEEDLKIYESDIEHKVLKELWDFVHENNMGITFNSTYKRFRNNMSNKKAIEIKKVEKIKNITQIVVNSDNGESIQKLQQLVKKKYETLEVKNIWKYSENSKEVMEMDITNKFNCKGNAIDILLKFLKIPKENSMCFGDGVNDISMFNACGVKVAMKNANDFLKQNADFETEYTNNENGVAKFVNFFWKSLAK